MPVLLTDILGAAVIIGGMFSRLTFPWLKSAGFDLSFILLPSFLSVIVAILVGHFNGSETGVSAWAWVILILGIDVAHVYSTLFRTYFNPREWDENKKLLILIPILVWSFGFLFYSISEMLFWRMITYVAVFHFIRQQYGFLRLYSREEKEGRWLGSAIIYLATLYPILYWHTHRRNFYWFLDGDFFSGIPTTVSTIAGYCYLVVIALYFGTEFYRKQFNVPKNLIVVGTMASWYVGIVWFNGDLIFTITNVVAHGIPYVALVWLYGDKQKSKPNAPLLLNRFRWSVPIFFGTLLFLAYLEEGLWAGFLWREHFELLGPFQILPEVTTVKTKALLVPLLILPQATHYILDGFIWKLKDSAATWQKILLR